MQIENNLTIYNSNPDCKELKPVIFYIEDKSNYNYKLYKQLNYPCVVTSINSHNDLNIFLILVCALLMVVTLFSFNYKQLIFMSVVDLFFMFLLLLFNILNTSGIASIDEIRKQMAWVYQHIEHYGGDKNNTMVFGNYYGAQIGSLMTFDWIKGFIGCNGIYSDKRLNRLTSSYNLFPIYNVKNETPPHLLLNMETNESLKKHTLDYHFALLSKTIYVKTIYFTCSSQIIPAIDDFISNVKKCE
jgi:hypothetical protein